MQHYNKICSLYLYLADWWKKKCSDTSLLPYPYIVMAKTMFLIWEGNTIKIYGNVSFTLILICINNLNEEKTSTLGPCVILRSKLGRSIKRFISLFNKIAGIHFKATNTYHSTWYIIKDIKINGMFVRNHGRGTIKLVFFLSSSCFLGLLIGLRRRRLRWLPLTVTIRVHCLLEKIIDEVF